MTKTAVENLAQNIILSVRTMRYPLSEGDNENRYADTRLYFSFLASQATMATTMEVVVAALCTAEATVSVLVTITVKEVWRGR